MVGGATDENNKEITGVWYWVRMCCSWRSESAHRQSINHREIDEAEEYSTLKEIVLYFSVRKHFSFKVNAGNLGWELLTERAPRLLSVAYSKWKLHSAYLAQNLWQKPKRQTITYRLFRRAYAEIDVNNQNQYLSAAMRCEALRGNSIGEVLAKSSLSMYRCQPDKRRRICYYHRHLRARQIKE